MKLVKNGEGASISSTYGKKIDYWRPIGVTGVKTNS